MPGSRIVTRSTDLDDVVSNGGKLPIAVQPPLFSLGSGITVTNPKFYSGYVAGVASGSDVVMYTCPSNRRCAVLGLMAIGLGGSNSIVTPKVITGGTSYAIMGGFTVYASGASAATFSTFNYILEAGDQLAINVSVTGVTAWATLVEFDNTCPVKTVKLATFIAGDNTLYTAPTGKTALLLDTAGGIVSAGRVSFYNASGATRTVHLNLVPSGSSPSTTNQIAPGFTVPNGNKSPVAISGSLNTGDYLSVNTDANTAGQLAFITVVEQ